MAVSDQKRTAAPDTAICIKNLNKIYKLYDRHIDRLKESINPFGGQYHKKFSALSNLNLEVGKGEVLGIIGRNGAGKSTLLNIIAGVTTPSSGEVFARGKVTAMLGLGTGFNPELTGIENVFINGTLQGYTKDQLDAKLDDILAFADIGSFAYQPIKMYSNGMQARLGFAIAINVDPEILIIDEVLSVGDELFRRKCFAKIGSFLAKGKTILFVTHGISIINELCTRAILLDRGELILDGPPKLVTIYYQKFLYAKPADQNKVRDEIISLNQDVEKKADFAARVLKESGRKETGSKKVIIPPEKPEKPQQQPVFLSGFESKSKVIQKSADIDVTDIHISTWEGRKVNFLVTGERYLLKYRVKFNHETRSFAFSWALKNETGLVLSGARYPGRSGTFRKAVQNEIYSLQWSFMCTLLEGIYYVDIGVPKLTEGKREMLVALYDILAFKVQKPDLTHEEEHSWAILKMDQKVESLEILT